MAKWIKRNSIKVSDDMLLIEKLAKVRGIKNLDEWMNPPSSYMNSPYSLENIDEAVRIIIEHIYKQSKIVVVADIDTDGVCSTGIMFRFLKRLTPNVSIIHAQRSKGHGLETVIDLIADDVDLVVVVDSSSNSVDACKELSEKGKPVVVIDHHKIERNNPYAVIVNCQLGSYPNKSLSGSAMCYKVCQVIEDYMGLQGLANEYIDLAAVGLVADMMDVRNMENRYLIYNGMNNIKNIGIKEILRQSKIDYKEGIRSTDISFKIAPIIGACSRFDKIELAIELVTTEDEERVKELVKEMIKLNESRKAEQKEVVERATECIDNSNNVIIYIDDEIESGFRGLIATELAERFSKPVFVVSKVYNKEKNTYEYKGSGRSIGVIPLQSLCADSGLFIEAQGHESAFGVSFSVDNLDKIISYFNDTLDSTEDLQKVIEYDLELSANNIEEMDIMQIEKFSRIVGQGFPEPKFLIKGLVAEESYTKKLGDHVRAVMGKSNDTVKINCEGNFALMKFRTHENYAKEIEDHFYDKSNFCTELDVVGSLNLNKFYNRGLKRWVTTKQIFIDDFRIVE